MTDDREVAGLDPFALLDDEAGRLDAFLSGLGESGWKQGSRCAGWTVRDVLGHLAASEDYHRACLDGTVGAFMAGFAARGGTDLDSINAFGVADYAALSPAEVLARWRAASAGNRRRFRAKRHSVARYHPEWQVRDAMPTESYGNFGLGRVKDQPRPMRGPGVAVTGHNPPGRALRPLAAAPAIACNAGRRREMGAWL
jgi:Mycothiol maleylpyruvate isomerase N-terminal domain